MLFRRSDLPSRIPVLPASHFSGLMVLIRAVGGLIAPRRFMSSEQAETLIALSGTLVELLRWLIILVAILMGWGFFGFMQRLVYPGERLLGASLPSAPYWGP